MDPFGRQVIAELWECDTHLLNDMESIEQIFVDAALKAGAEIREVVFHQFAPHGVSGVVMISESHLTIHSFPEHGYASIDVYTCGHRIDPNIASDYIAKALQAKTYKKTEIARGMAPVNVKYFRSIL